MRGIVLRFNDQRGDVRKMIEDSVRCVEVPRIEKASCGPYGYDPTPVVFTVTRYVDSGRRTAEGLELWLPQP